VRVALAWLSGLFAGLALSRAMWLLALDPRRLGANGPWFTLLVSALLAAAAVAFRPAAADRVSDAYLKALDREGRS
jgi:hypothetical protein